MLTGAGRLDCGVQRQNIGLEGNAINDSDDVADLAARFIDTLHGEHHLAHHLATAGRSGTGGHSECIGLTGTFGRLGHRTGELRHRAGRALQVSSRLLGPVAEVFVTRRNLVTGYIDAASTATHRGNCGIHARQRFTEHGATAGGGRNVVHVEVDRVFPVDLGHEHPQLVALPACASHVDRHDGLHAGLDDHVHRMDHDAAKVGLGDAVQTKTRCLQTVKHHVVDRIEHGTENNDPPIAVGQEERQGNEHPEVHFLHAPGELDVQCHERDQHKRQHKPAEHGVTGHRKHPKGKPQQQHRGGNGQPTVYKRQAQCDRHHRRQHDG